jgi:3',5'-cyclic-AMP phosphodiesterase
MLIAQFSDLHIKAQRQRAYGVVDTAWHLEQAVAHLLSQDPLPDALVITGDLVDHGTSDEYQVLRELLAPLTGALPIYLIAGNHDDPDELRKAFADHPYLQTDHGAAIGHLSWSVDLGPIQLVGLDTTLPKQGGGGLDAERLAWLDACLSAQEALGARRRSTPAVILAHHPPFATGIGHMDAIGLAGTDTFLALLQRHPRVERVLCGHLHRAIHARVGGTIASTCPSTAHQVVLDLSPTGADCFVMEPPGYQLHQWNGRCLVTHTVVVGSYPGPYPFRMAGQLID